MKTFHYLTKDRAVISPESMDRVMPKATVSVQEKIFTHVYLWKSASALLDLDLEKPPQYTKIPALLLSFMAYEAFINYAGEIICPDVWENERKEFSGKGLDGKVDAICKNLPGMKLNKGITPYQNIKKLEKFRNMIVHGRVQRNEIETKRKEDGSHFSFKHDWDPFIEDQNIAEFRSSIIEFCKDIVRASKSAVSETKYFDFYSYEDPFDMPLGFGEGRS